MKKRSKILQIALDLNSLSVNYTKRCSECSYKNDNWNCTKENKECKFVTKCYEWYIQIDPNPIYKKGGKNE